jgi:hypothetical protein
MLDRETQLEETREGRGRALIPISVDTVRLMLNTVWLNTVWTPIISAVGHPDIARIFSDILGYRIEASQVSAKLYRDDKAIVGQYVGPRIPKGSTTLPEGAKIEWWLV